MMSHNSDSMLSHRKSEHSIHTQTRELHWSAGKIASTVNCAANRQIKAIGNNINQITVRLHSSGNFYAEDMQEIKQKVGELWRLLLSIQSGQQSVLKSDTSLTQIRPSTDYMFRLISAEPIQEEQQRTSPISEKTEQEGQKF